MSQTAMSQTDSNLEKSLLIIDDDAPLRERLAKAMTKRGFNVSRTATKREREPTSIPAASTLMHSMCLGRDFFSLCDFFFM